MNLYRLDILFVLVYMTAMIGVKVFSVNPKDETDYPHHNLDSSNISPYGRNVANHDG